MLAVALVAGLIVALALNVRAARRGQRHITARQAGRFLLGSGGDGWGGPKRPSVWDQPGKDPW